MRAARAIDRCRELATLSETSDGLRRTFLSAPMHKVHRLLRGWMEEAGMQVSIDAAGNVRGLRPATRMPAPRLLLGSHVDTVPNAGAFDGTLGVMAAIELVELLGGRKAPFAIEVVAFSEEEGVRFGMPFIGSRALVGTLDAEALSHRDPAGNKVEEAIRAFGLDPANLPAAALDPQTFAYLELHIEQGPVLESLNAPVGVVTSIAGQTRLEITFRGQARHAGTTPMHLRHDALAAAARWITAVEDYANATTGLVATVGTVQVLPGAENVVPGEVRLSLDVRHQEDGIRRGAVEALLKSGDEIAKSRGLSVDWKEHLNVQATLCDPGLVAALSLAVKSAGFPLHHLPSGAGHDAMILAQKVPIAMLFVRSPGGISHHPDENVHASDVEAALAVGAAFLAELERRHV